jgi:hypothetical protein
MKNLLPALALSAIASLAITSCGDGDSSSTASTTSTTSESVTSTIPPSGPVKGVIVSPKAGTTTGNTVDATVRLSHLADGEHTIRVTVIGGDPPAPEAQASTRFVVKSGP